MFRSFYRCAAAAFPCRVRCSAESITVMSTCSGSAWPPLTRLFLHFPIFNQYLLHSHSSSSAVDHLSPTSSASYLACRLSKADIWIHYCAVQYVPSLRLSAPLSFTTCLFVSSVLSCFHGWHNCYLQIEGKISITIPAVSKKRCSYTS